MLWPKKNSYKEFDNEKIPAARKFPQPPPHNFSNGPSLSATRVSMGLVVSLQTSLPRGGARISFLPAKQTPAWEATFKQPKNLLVNRYD